MTKMVAGVDIGGSSTKACLVADGDMVADAAIPTTLGDPSQIGAVAMASIEKVLAESGHRLEDLDAIGMGVPGQVSSGRVHNAANLGIDESGFDLAAHVSTATGLRTIVENDTNVAAYGAYVSLSRTEPNLENLVYVGWGTGVSAGVVLGGRLHRGGHGLAGEFGHVPMGTGLLCACGTIGCLETVVGAVGLEEAWGSEELSGLFRSAESGDPTATTVVDSAIDHLAAALWWLAAAYDPDLFLIGGGVGVNNPVIETLLAARWEEMATGSALARRVLDPDRIRISDLEEPVGAYGAALLVGRETDRLGATNPDKTWEEETGK